MIARATGRGKPPGRAAGAVGTVLIHAAAAGLLFATVEPPPKPGPPAYQVNLTAAPAPAPKRRAALSDLPTPPVEKPPEPKPKPKPTPKPPAQKAVPIKPPKPKATPKAATPQPPAPRPPEPVDRDPAPPAPSQVAPAPGETPSTGTDAATIKTPGREFPYPAYLDNIVNQVFRRWDQSAAKRSLSAEVEFSILSDGSVQDIRFITGSGSLAFDLNARGAIEAAGRDRAFGPLPKGWPAEVLRVSFLFKPTQLKRAP